MEDRKAPQKPNENEGREGRKGCGCCLNVLAIGGLILAVLVTVGVQWGLNMVEQQLFSSGSVTRPELDAWLKEPIRLPEISAAKPVPLPADLQARLTKLEAEIGKTREPMGKLTEWDETGSTAPRTPMARILSGTALTKSDTLALDDLASASQMVIPEISSLLADSRLQPGMAANQHQEDIDVLFGLPSGSIVNEIRNDDLRGYIAMQIAQGKLSSATDLLSCSAKLIIQVPPETIFYYTPIEFLQLARAIAKNTSNSAELRELQNCMEFHRSGMLNMSNEISFVGVSYVYLARQMKEEGFLPRLPATRAEIIEVKYRGAEFIRMLSKKYGDNNDKVRQAKGYLRGDSFMLEVVKFWPARLGMRFFSSRLLTWLALDAYQVWEREQTEVPRRIAEYDLLRAEIALQAAKADGLTVSSANALIPVYLQTLPDDPYTTLGSPAASDSTGTKTLRYSPENLWFYSVGPDGRDATGDEIIGVKSGQLESYHMGSFI